MDKKRLDKKRSHSETTEIFMEETLSIAAGLSEVASWGLNTKKPTKLEKPQDKSTQYTCRIAVKGSDIPHGKSECQKFLHNEESVQVIVGSGVNPHESEMSRNIKIQKGVGIIDFSAPAFYTTITKETFNKMLVRAQDFDLEKYRIPRHNIIKK